MLVKIKNRAPHAVLLKSKAGDVIQINSGAIKEVSDEFLVSYNTKEIQLLSRKPIHTEILQKEEGIAASEAEIAVKSANSSKASKKSSSTTN